MKHKVRISKAIWFREKQKYVFLVEDGVAGNFILVTKTGKYSHYYDRILAKHEELKRLSTSKKGLARWIVI